MKNQFMRDPASNKPVPEVTPMTRPFLAAAANGELRLQKCRGCGHIRFPLGPVCTDCLDEAFDWHLLSGKGTILSHLVFHRAYSPAWRSEIPYSVIMVQLEEGPRLFSDVVDPDRKFIDTDLVGRRAEVQFELMAPNIGVPRFAILEQD
jgi:uncharacterized OB-fold protein